MDFNQNSDYSDNQFQQAPYNQSAQRPGGFAIASLTCGIIAVAACCTGILGIPFGALSILFAALSKRKGQKMPGMSLAGIILSIFGILLGIAMTAYSFYLVFNEPAVRQQVDSVFQSMYGMSLEDFFEIY